jgi:ribonuclease HI
MNNKNNHDYIAYTDGSVFPNPGIGGWGFVLLKGDRTTSPHDDAEIIIEKFGGEPDSTNNRMEIQGVIEAIAATPQNDPLLIYSDSQYVVHGYMLWMKKWAWKEWRGVKNSDLWQQLYKTKCDRLDNVQIEWVRGHVGVKWNEHADQLAGKGRYDCIKRLERAAFEERIQLEAFSAMSRLTLDVEKNAN